MAKRILILEDEEQLLYTLKKHFTSFSFEVDATSHEGMARRLVEQKTYSVAILDLGLARLDRTLGLDMIGFIRRRNPQTGIIVYTGNDNPVVEKLALQLGADCFVRKPVPMSDLDKIVFRFCERELALVYKKK